MIIRIFDICSTCICAYQHLEWIPLLLRSPKIALCLRVPESQTPAYALMIVNWCFCLCRE